VASIYLRSPGVGLDRLGHAGRFHRSDPAEAAAGTGVDHRGPPQCGLFQPSVYRAALRLTMELGSAIGAMHLQARQPAAVQSQSMVRLVPAAEA
jgi:hypothetical protein